MKRFIIILFLVLTFAAPACNIWGDSTAVTVRGGYNIGGTMPLGLPATIRSIDAFRLTPSFVLGVDVSLPLASRWSASVGMFLENKAMEADVAVKGYHMAMEHGTSHIDGLFTGYVRQDVTQWMITVPLLVRYELSPAWRLKGGPYFSLLVYRQFDGIATDGYLRQGDPTGPKIIIGNQPGSWATYDFSDDMRRWQMGLAAGIDWQPHRCWGMSFDIKWGVTGVFKSSFKTVEQTLYPVYGTVEIFYRIR